MLIGRDAEQAAVAQLVAAARVGHSGVLLVTGDAGLGKTALLDHAAARAQGMCVLRAAGTEPERNIAFGGLLQLLRPALDLLPAIPAPQAAALGVALALQEGATRDRFAVGAATLSLLSRFADEQPLLLLVDDAHVLDRPSAEVLLFVGRRLMAEHVGLVIASRPEPSSTLLESDLPRLRLAGLGRESTATLLHHHARRPVAPDTVAQLFEVTGGNPLAIVEYASELHRFDTVAPHTPVPVPEMVTHMFARRIAQLSEPAQAAILLAAISDGDLTVVGRAAKAFDADVAHLTDAEDAGLLRLEAGHVEFRHPLVRASVYTAASQSLRRRAHAAVAEALPAGDERQAWHRSESVVGFDAPLARRMQQIGDRARDRSAYDVAATAYERAAALTEDAPERARRLLAAGESAWLAGHSDRAAQLLERAGRTDHDVRLRADVDALRGTIALRAGSLDEAHTILVDAASQIASADPDGAVMLLADVVLAHLYLADGTGAAATARRISGLLPDTTTQRAHGRGELAVGIADVLAGLGGIDHVRAAVERIAAATDELVDPSRPEWRVLGPLFLRESGTGRDLIGQAVEEMRDRSAVGSLSTVLFYAARHAATTDRWPTAVSGYREAIDLARETGDATILVVSRAGLAWLDARMGRAAQCRENAAEVLRPDSTHRVHLGRIWAMFAIGDLELAQGNVDDASTRYSELTELLTDLGVLDVDVWPGPELAEALTRAGQAEAGRRAAVTYADKAREKGQPWAMARAARGLALTADAQSQTGQFEQALALHAGAVDAYEEARTQLAFGASLRRRRRRVAARPHLRAALSTFERLGAAPWASTAAQELDATGETPQRRGTDPLDLLTPQELQIARMLGAGRTTREAAAALFLSPKTVEYHLRHVYTKLGIHSRGELAAAVGAGSARS